MSGHSRWSNIKNRKGKSDIAKSKIYTKIGRELYQAVKQGGAEINSNSKLRDVIEKAKQANMPSENIQRTIKKASGTQDSVNYETITYECYAPNGIAMIVVALTDNKNKTAAEVRHIFDRSGGSLGTTGCVSYLFQKKGVIVIPRNNMTEDKIMEFCIEHDIDDYTIYDEELEFFVSVEKYESVKNSIEKLGIKAINSSIDFIPNNYISLDEEAQEKILKLLLKMDENDDIIRYFHNAELTIENI